MSPIVTNFIKRWEKVSLVALWLKTESARDIILLQYQHEIWNGWEGESMYILGSKQGQVSYYQTMHSKVRALKLLSRGRGVGIGMLWVASKRNEE